MIQISPSMGDLHIHTHTYTQKITILVKTNVKERVKQNWNFRHLQVFLAAISVYSADVQTISFHGHGVGVLTFARALHSMIDWEPRRSAPEIQLYTWQVCFSLYAGEQQREKVSGPPGSTPAAIYTRANTRYPLVMVMWPKPHPTPKMPNRKLLRYLITKIKSLPVLAQCMLSHFRYWSVIATLLNSARWSKEFKCKMALPGVEITITLDDIDAEIQSNQPQVVVHGAQNAGQEQKRKNQQQLQTQAQGDTEQSQERSAQGGQSGSSRPKLLPFLSEIRNRGQPRQTGMFQHNFFLKFCCSRCRGMPASTQQT